MNLYGRETIYPSKLRVGKGGLPPLKLNLECRWELRRGQATFPTCKCPASYFISSSDFSIFN